jgi:hypothetical protein
MDPCIECPYCGINLLEWRCHDLLDCKMTASARARTQTEELKEIWSLEDPRPEEKK